MVVKKKNPCVPSDPSTTNAAAARPSSRVRSSCDTIPMLDPSQARKRWLRNASRSPVGSQSWTVTSRRVSPGGITAFTSWSRPIDTFPNETPPGETRLDVTVQLWDPTGDLEAFLEQRFLAWG